MILVTLATSYSFAQNQSIDCNDAQDIRGYLEKNTFKGVPTTIVGAADLVEVDMFYDYAQLTIILDGKETNMAEVLQTNVRAGASEGFNTAAIVTKNENFCDESLKAIIFNDFDKAKYDSSINAHIWNNPDSDEDLIFTRVNPIDIGNLNNGR